DAAYANEYIDWLAKLVHENLPKYKHDFESYINDTITYKIGGLNEEMEKWERDINNSVNRLNQSLSAINFNRLPDTYIQLGKRPVPAGTDIKEFRARLLDALPQAANWQQSSFEDKSKHFTQKVRPLIDELDKNESYRNKVMDVRNWFEFWADEKFRNTDELKKTYRQMGQLSGGEKAQLTYTILCSAIAYQFGITREGKNSRSLRFIAVDESFSNQDEEKATYLMELCKQLHLQLLVVTPSDKIAIVQNFIAHVHLVQRVQNRNSVLYNMTIKELREQVEEGSAVLQA
ncbi:MAG TPA: SbcC/MukB-like Walker B domain-containing protein, partial [Niastella sp.]